MAGYDVYLGNILLPIAPESISMKISGRNKVYSLINEGELNVLKLPGLSTVSFSILLPVVQYPFATYPNGFNQPSYYLDELEKLKINKKPFQFIISRRDNMTVRKNSHNTNMTVSLEDYTIKEDAKSNGFDIKVDISLKQYKEFKTKTFEVTLPSPTAPIAVTPVRPQSTVPSANKGRGVPNAPKAPTSPNYNYSGTGGIQKQKYKVQIPGMSVLEKIATSVQDAITQAMGTTWTGTVYVNNNAYYVNNGKLAKTAWTTAPDSVKTSVKVVTKPVTIDSNSKNDNKISGACNSILNRNILTTNKSGGITTTTVVTPKQKTSGKATTFVTTRVSTKTIQTTK